MKIFKLIIIILILPILLTGCWDYKLYEQTGFILQVGIENVKNNMLVTYSLPVVISGNLKEQTELLSFETSILREGREKARRISSKVIEGGKIQQLLFSEDIASNGLNPYFELFERDNIIPSTCHIVLVDGSPRELMDSLQKFTDKPLPAFYIDNLLSNNISHGYSPEMRLNIFTTKFFSNTIDPIAPVIRLNYQEGKGAEIVGIALFSHDKMVGRISVDKTPILLSLINNYKGSEYISKSFENDFDSSSKQGAAFTLSKVKRKVNINIIDNKTVVDISLSYKARLTEYKYSAVTDISSKEEIENILSKEITENSLEILRYCQDVGSDPLGIQEMIRAFHNSYYKSLNNWDTVYKDIKFNVKTNIELNHFGVIK
ncbi:MAG: Ger(x)C family spore germination protein [Clostridiaceae bacterium]